jgi:hypothetical protein
MNIFGKLDIRPTFTFELTDDEAALVVYWLKKNKENR